MNTIIRIDSLWKKLVWDIDRDQVKQRPNGEGRILAESVRERERERETKSDGKEREKNINR